jgi:hypothetical protein
MTITRRHLISWGVKAAAGWALLRPVSTWAQNTPQFFFAQIQYRGGEWDPNPQFVKPMAEELELRTSIRAFAERRVTTIGDPDIFYYPFLYLSGKYDFEPFTAEEQQILRRLLTYGGFLLAEDAMGAKGFGFDRAFRREMQKIFPSHPLRRLPPDHSVYQSFYLLDAIGGRQRVHPYLEGVVIGNWTPVIYCQNDLAGAWAKDKFGKWVNECAPGGEGQRAAAFKAGVNIIVYSLTSDYKKDVVHHPFLKRRQNL